MRVRTEGEKLHYQCHRTISFWCLAIRVNQLRAIVGNKKSLELPRQAFQTMNGRVSAPRDLLLPL